MNIKIEKTEKTDSGWVFLVNLEGLEYSVTLASDYWQQLTSGVGKPGDLVIKSFEFLLERESKESILKQFDLKVISQYFPEFEKMIKSK